VRALLIVNPRATSTNGRAARVVTRELAGHFDLEATQTRYRSHATELAAASAGFDLVLAFGGDGTVNETVNGLMKASSPAAFAPIPGGGANVFARSLGLPTNPVAAVSHILDTLAARRSRTIGLGLAGERYFTFSAGLGLDAEVVADVERLRAAGRQATPVLYMWTTLRRYYLTTDRREPALSLEIDGQPPVTHLFMGVVTNSAPWTYLGNRAVSAVPTPDFNSGLDVFALRRLRTITTLAALQQMLHTRERPPRGRDVVSVVGEPYVTFRSRRQIAFHIDGEYIGETSEVSFHFVPEALRVMA
jgi:diacylglycerol kinase family enzyme